MEFETERCVVRPFTSGEIDAFMAYRNDSDWMRFQGFKELTKQEYEEALLKRADLPDGVQLAVVSKDTGELIGDLYLKREDNVCWIGYSAAPQYARQGFLSEAVSGAMRQLKRLGVVQVKAGVVPGNIASIAFLKKLRFIESGMQDGEFVYVFYL